MADSDFYTVGQAAQRMGISEDDVATLVRAGRFPGARREGGQESWRVPIGEVSDWVLMSGPRPTRPPIAGLAPAPVERLSHARNEAVSASPAMPARNASQPIKSEKKGRGVLGRTAAIATIISGVAALAVLIGLASNLRPDDPAVSPAAPGENLILIATFDDPAGTRPHREIFEAMTNEAENLGLNNIRVEIHPDSLVRGAGEVDDARALGEGLGAVMVIWGEATNAATVANFLHLGETDPALEEGPRIKQAQGAFVPSLEVPKPDVTFVVRDLPSYLSFFALFALGHTEFVETDYEEAARLIERAVAAPTAEAAGGNPADLTEGYEDFIDGLAAAYFRLGWLHHVPLSDVETALLYWDRAVELDPDDPAARTNRGNALLTLEQPASAIEDFDRALELDPTSRAALLGRGAARAALSDIEGAIEDFNEALSVDPESALAYHNRALAREASGDVVGAIEDYGRASEADPGWADPLVNRGGLYISRGEIELALKDLNRAIAIDPESALAYSNRGLAYQNSDDPQAAIDDYTKSIDLDDQAFEPFMNRGNVYGSIGELRLALEDLNIAVGLADSDPRPYHNRGRIHLGLRDTSSELADYTKAIELDPRYGPARTSRAELYLGLEPEFWQRAVEDAEIAVEVNPSDPRSRLLLGRALIDTGQPDDALVHLEEFRQLEPTDPIVLYFRSKALADKADFAAAIDQLLQFQDDPTARNRYPAFVDRVEGWIESMEAGVDPLE